MNHEELPKCLGRTRHHWAFDCVWGSDHGGVRTTHTCAACGTVRHYDTGGTDWKGCRINTTAYVLPDLWSYPG